MHHGWFQAIGRYMKYTRLRSRCETVLSFSTKMDLAETDLTETNLTETDLAEMDLAEPDLTEPDLTETGYS